MDEEIIETAEEEVEEVEEPKQVRSDYSIETADETVDSEEEEVDWRARYEAEQERLQKREKELNKGFEEVARNKKLIEQLASGNFAPTAPAVAPPNVPELSDDARMAIDRHFAATYGPVIGTVQTMYQELAESELQAFAKESGIDAEELKTIVVENDLQPKEMSLTSIKESLRKAALLHQGSTTSREAIEEQMRAKILRELAEKGVEVQEVTAKKAKAPAPPSDPDFERMTYDQRLQWYRDKGLLPE